MSDDRILVVGGYGEVGRRLALGLEGTQRGRVILGGRHPVLGSSLESRRIDVDDPVSIDAALDGVGVVVACVRQREPHLLRAAVRHGLAYTSIAPPWIPWSATDELRTEARKTGARIVLAAGLEPGISSVLARIAAERLSGVDSVASALLLGLGDAFGPDSMAFIFEEVADAYSVTIDGAPTKLEAFERPTRVRFPDPIGTRTAYSMPFRDQLYFPSTLGARTAIARITFDPPWLAAALALLLPLGLRRSIRRGGGRGAARAVVERLRHVYRDCDSFALVVEVTRGNRMIRASLVGRHQADATAAGVEAIVEALHARESNEPGVFLAEHIIDASTFLARVARRGLVPRFEETSAVEGMRL